jgi:hypothetical protein
MIMRISLKKSSFFLLVVAFLCAATHSSAQTRAKIGTAVGEYYPDFKLPTLEGKLARMSDYRGKKILLFHFASW